MRGFFRVIFAWFITFFRLYTSNGLWDHNGAEVQCAMLSVWHVDMKNILRHGHFRSTSGKTFVQQNSKKKSIEPKLSSESLLSYFWAITSIAAVIGILDPFGTLVPQSSATVKMELSDFWSFFIDWNLFWMVSAFTIFDVVGTGVYIFT